MMATPVHTGKMQVKPIRERQWERQARRVPLVVELKVVSAQRTNKAQGNHDASTGSQPQSELACQIVAQYLQNHLVQQPYEVI
jgi:hypothetical protein